MAAALDKVLLLGLSSITASWSPVLSSTFRYSPGPIQATVRFLFGDGRTSLISCLVSVQRLITLESQKENYLTPTCYLKLQTPIQLHQLLSSLFFFFSRQNLFFPLIFSIISSFSFSIWAIPSALAEALGVLIHDRITWFWHSLHVLPAYPCIILSLQRCAVDTCSFKLLLSLPRPCPLAACVITARASYFQ